MLTDANGNERKGIEVWCDILEELEVFSGDQWRKQVERGTYSITLYKTVRDLMLAGF